MSWAEKLAGDSIIIPISEQDQLIYHPEIITDINNARGKSSGEKNGA